jgi:transposase
MTAIKGVSHLTVAVFYAEVGDISNYHHPRQIQNLAGLSLRRQESGQYKGKRKSANVGEHDYAKSIPSGSPYGCP